MDYFNVPSPTDAWPSIFQIFTWVNDKIGLFWSITLGVLFGILAVGLLLSIIKHK